MAFCAEKGDHGREKIGFEPTFAFIFIFICKLLISKIAYTHECIYVESKLSIGSHLVAR